MLMIYLKLQTALQSLRDARGQDLIEYVLLGALIAVACATAIEAVATAISNEFNTIAGDS